MKTTHLIFFLIISTASFAQSNSYQALREKFSDSKDVHHFGTSGFFARTILWMAGEHEFKKAVKDIQSIKFITIPTSEFAAKGVTVNGFRKVLQKDSFEELAHVTDHGDHVTLYMQPTKNENNRYILLVEETDNVVVIEIKGYIDPNLMLNPKSLAVATN